jgi:hypothetical protein
MYSEELIRIKEGKTITHNNTNLAGPRKQKQNYAA